jgi:prefoldin subunit 5
VDPRSELEALEAYRSDLEEELKEVDARIRELKELLSKESEKP